ncbi:hypothetical protein [Paenirhodobacter sp. CAU 1674]|uniref:hypothetical protein n=1 Tax=Paenirhodobacter sp. CAU 1674 TaxID=3032596 RepID=UPI0023D97C3E|nr:hypothetical protein [Paenirhodobacter sp. CAU 1674]MDF2140860.1 hypothetical protein [Paenirhodobacter sp. CAU 1674]
MIAIWPTSIRQLPQRGDWDGGPRDDRAIFEPESGPPILRRRVTGVTSEFSATFPKLRAAQVAAFEAWFQDDLANGSLPFLFRDPVRGDVARWMIPGGNGRPYSYRANGADLHDLSMTLLRMPGNAAVAPYVIVQADGSLRAPYVVADYDAGVFLIDGVSVPASSVAAIAGTYDVLTVSDLGVETWELAHTVLAGDIPATAPVDVSRILAFTP